MAASTIQDYLNLIPSANARQPNFVATVELTLSPLVQIQALMQSMIDTIFDLSQNPVGDQLDIIGLWVGVSRVLKIPITGIFFTWNGAVAQGWSYGIWQDPVNPPTSITVLPDDAYLTLIKARIAANHWDGTTEGAYAIFAILFPNLIILIQDNQNMSFAVAVQGSIPDSLTLALLTGGYLPLKPGAIRISEYFLPVDTHPFFAWSTDTHPLTSPHLAGWGTGSWANEVPST